MVRIGLLSTFGNIWAHLANAYNIYFEKQKAEKPSDVWFEWKTVVMLFAKFVWHAIAFAQRQ